MTERNFQESGGKYRALKKILRYSANIADPIHACAERIKLLAAGDLHTAVEVDDSLEEAQVLTTAAVELTTSLNALIQDMDYILAELAKGDFTVESQNRGSYIGDFESLLGSVRELKIKLSETLQHIQESANQVMRGIEDEIRQITDVVQNNSATAQESSAICEELSAQAMGLNGLVEEFSI